MVVEGWWGLPSEVLQGQLLRVSATASRSSRVCLPRSGARRQVLAQPAQRSGPGPPRPVPTNRALRTRGASPVTSEILFLLHEPLSALPMRERFYVPDSVAILWEEQLTIDGPQWQR